MKKIKEELLLQDAIKNISEKTILAIKESGVSVDTIAERMQMGNKMIVEQLVKGGGVDRLQLGTLVRLIYACRLEMHVKFIPSEAEDEMRVVRSKK